MSELTEVERDLEVLRSEPEHVSQLLDPLLQTHQSATQPLHLVVAEGPALHASQRLPLEELANQADDREDQPGQPLFRRLGIGRDAPERATGTAGRLPRD